MARAETAALVARARIVVRGTVQGVGFRPHVYRLAHEHGLAGWVANSGEGVVVEAEGEPTALATFAAELRSKAPPLAVVEAVEVAPLPPTGVLTSGERGFSIRESQPGAGQLLPVPPDVATCDDCRRELRDPADRRHGYPFVNCTNCGPRYTIIEDVPYDRPLTTMRAFAMCADCAREYDDPADRRFHAQPNACPRCGPRLWVEEGVDLTPHPPRWSCGSSGSPQRRRGRETAPADGHPSSPALAGAAAPADLPAGEGSRTSADSPLPPGEGPGVRAVLPLSAAERGPGGEVAPVPLLARLILQGAVVAVRGVGGFHLACDATNPAAVATLRQRKRRGDKPFAIMCPDLATVEAICHLDDAERQLIASPARPIVLLKRRASPVANSVAAAVAPGQRTLGVMLPYTPLHDLLFDELRCQRPPDDPSERTQRPLALVLTSGNLADEPIAVANDEARSRLRGLADAFVLHDREIHARCDDSVARVFRGRPTLLRRSRGYVPAPLRLRGGLAGLPPTLACGAELKNTFCLARDGYAIPGPHVGDLESLETYESYRAAIAHFERLLRVEPQVLAYDLHPDYLSTRYAAERLAASAGRLRGVAVQHHHAHVAACMVENGLDGPVLGLAADGTGYGSDGAVWGGELLVADYAGFRRAGHLDYVPLPGGDAAVRRPARMALSYLHAAYGADVPPDLPLLARLAPAELRTVRRQLTTGFNAPPTSSLGRLFDGVAALLDVRDEVSYEGQAAVELEALAEECPESGGGYAWPLGRAADGTLLLEPAPLVRQIVAERLAGVPRAAIAARFHRAVAAALVAACVELRAATGLERVCLSGGVFQNATLLGLVLDGLAAAGLAAFTHRLVPPNDGGLALGQAAVASQSTTDSRRQTPASSS